MDISKIKTNNTTYDVKDSTARGNIESIDQTVAVALNKLNIESTKATDEITNVNESYMLAISTAINLLNKKITFLQIALDKLRN